MRICDNAPIVQWKEFLFPKEKIVWVRFPVGVVLDLGKLYTAGYKNWFDEDFYNKVKELDAYVIDVRLVPYAFFPYWKKEYIQKALGDKYIHIKELGNKNYHNSKLPIEISDISKLSIVKQMLSEGKTCILLCACKDCDTCHRKILADTLCSELDITFLDLKGR